MDVLIGKNITMAVDVATMPQVALDYVIYIGLRNVLMDAHASATEEKHGSDFRDVARAMAEKKLAALMQGEVRAAPSATRTSDPVKQRANAIALRGVNAAWRAAGKRAADMDTATRNRLVGEYLEKNPKILEVAAAQIAAEADLMEPAI